MASKSSKSLSDSLDKILLAVGALVLIAALVFAAMGLSKKLEPLESATRALRKDAKDLPLEPFQERMDELGSIYETKEGLKSLVFTSEQRVRSTNSKELYVLIPIDAKKCPFTGEEQPDIDKEDTDGDGILNGYERLHGLNMSVADAWGDSDGDGFYNIEEFKSGTAANDENSHPPYITKLRLVKAANRPQRFEMVGVSKISDTKTSFSIKMSGVNGTKFREIGGEIDGWKLMTWTPKKPETIGAPDLSELVLSKGDKTVVLTKAKSGVLNQWKAALLYLPDPSLKFRVSEGVEFELLGDKFVVNKISRSEVKVTALSTGEAYFLQKISSEEVSIIKGERKPGEASGFTPADDEGLGPR